MGSDITTGGPVNQQNSPSVLDDHQKGIIRLKIVETAKSFEGIIYEREDDDPTTPWTGKGKWLDFSKPPKSLDCSGLNTAAYQFNGLKLPHGSQNQFNFTIAIDTPKIGDLGFWGRGKDITKVYHTGMLVSATEVINAYEYNEKQKFKTGCVIIRPKENWDKFENFLGWRVHPKLV